MKQRIKMTIPKKHTDFIAHVALLNNGMVMGDEDAISFANYTKSTRCKSIRGEVFAISSSDFFNLIKTSETAESMIHTREMQKI